MIFDELLRPEFGTYGPLVGTPVEAHLAGDEAGCQGSYELGRGDRESSQRADG